MLADRRFPGADRPGTHGRRLKFTTDHRGELREQAGFRDRCFRVILLALFGESETLRTGMIAGQGVRHGILETHQATVEVDSRPGEGTEIRIVLPIAQAASAAGETPQLAEAHPSG